jgi:hypothetical protein
VFCLSAFPFAFAGICFGSMIKNLGDWKVVPPKKDGQE